jgi:predicted nucleic acid-binding protein
VIQLDTSFLIRALAPGTPEDASLREWIRQRAVVGISALAWTEFMCGPVTPEVIAIAGRLLGEPVPYSAPEAELAARLFNETGRRRGSMVDCMLAATAIQANDLATVNRAGFRRFEKLGLVLAT